MGVGKIKCHNCGKPFFCKMNFAGDKFSYCCNAPKPDSLMKFKSPVIPDHKAEKRNQVRFNPEYLELAKPYTHAIPNTFK